MHVGSSSGNDSAEVTTPLDSVSVVLLAGGVGKRMGAKLPKQYIQLGGKEIALYSFEVFANMDHVGEVIVVCEEEWESLFKGVGIGKPLKFARPGKERQDSCFNGLQMAREGASLVAIHDSARPLLKAEDALACFNDAMQYGAAVLAVPVKSTIKEVDKDSMLVVRTPERATLWDVQTPQVMKPDLLRKGFDKVKAEDLEVTDDVSIIEQLGEPVRITVGDYYNIKLTTPEDLQLAESVLT
ncbi:2-C-methyl-D-erythritol 4-phosphate cytidylyltransferase [Chloropicon primus]|nr:2-C-methyl-D-erythritol 4-phosphate cytidylyltransferase [Chloropicon primus]